MFGRFIEQDYWRTGQERSSDAQSFRFSTRKWSAEFTDNFIKRNGV
jgi:hypothetical protein